MEDGPHEQGTHAGRLLTSKFAALLLAAMNAGNASADRLPTDTELRAAYCIPIIRQDLNLISRLVRDNETRIAQLGGGLSDRLQGEWADKKRAEAAANAERIAMLREANDQLARHKANRETTFNRLRLYLVPKLQELEIGKIAAAHARGDADIRSADNGVACLTACTQRDRPASCVDRCTDRDLQARMDACRSPNWLPL